MLYSISNPAIDETVGKVNAEAHVLDIFVSIGAVGKITTFTILPDAHAPGPAVPATVLPQVAVKT